MQADGTVIRNDTGVCEGGEISMYYDPMIAKLCTWGPDRPTAVHRWRMHSTRTKSKGIGHNLPFLSGRDAAGPFPARTADTAYIAEEFKDGFQGWRRTETSARKSPPSRLRSTRRSRSAPAGFPAPSATTAPDRRP